MALQPRGESVQWVPISSSGRNALDFHIAFFLGELWANDPTGHYHVISKDKGFDPLLRYLTDRKRRFQRASALSELSFLAPRVTDGLDEQVEVIVANLRSRGSARPRKRKTLMSTIDDLFRKKLMAAEVEKLIEGLERRNLIAITEGAITYRL